MEELRDRVAVVTGSGSGIGRGIALALAGEGMHVVVADIERDSAEAVAAELRRKEVRAIAVHADVSKQASVDSLAEAAYAEFGAVHLLINNAGVVQTGKLDGLSERDWHWVFSINLYGIVNGCRAFVPRMKAQQGERHIVNTTSMAGVAPIDFLEIGLYTSSKYASTGFSEMLRTELEPHGIGVSILCPGGVRTNLGATSARNRPAEYGGPLPPPERRVAGTAAVRPAPILATQMEPEDVGPVVVRGIRENRCYIFTHPEESRPLIDARFKHMLDDLQREEQSAGTTGRQT